MFVPSLDGLHYRCFLSRLSAFLPKHVHLQLYVMGPDLDVCVFVETLILFFVVQR